MQLTCEKKLLHDQDEPEQLFEDELQ